MESWVFKYLNHLQLDPESPSEVFLASLYKHHVARVPYEVTSKFVYWQSSNYVPTIECFVHNLLHRGFGGNCFTLNFNFMRLLHVLGFVGHLVKVNPGHVGLVVCFRARKYIVDVGYGAPLNQLVPLDRHTWYKGVFGEEIRFTNKSDRRITYDRLNNGQVFVSKEIDLTPVAESDFVDDIHTSFMDVDQNRFMRRISMALTTDSKYTWVRNNRVVTRTVSQENVVDFDCSKDWLECISHRFGVKQEDLQLTLSFLRERDVNLGFSR